MLLLKGVSPEWFGVGLGNSIQKLFYLPEAHTDFVLSIWAEETGLVGAVAVIALFAAFVFVEEIDYGLHWIEFINQVPLEEQAEVRNWHNEGERTSIMKDIMTAGTVLVFDIAPFAFRNTRNRLIRYLLPASQYAAGFIGIVLISRLAHYLNDLELYGCTVYEPPVFEALVGYIRRGEVRPVVAATYPLSDFHAAQEAFVAKAHTGAMVITVD